MTVSKVSPNPKKYKTALFRRRIIERIRLEMVTDQQLLTQLGISRTLLNQWNRTYQRCNERSKIITPYGPTAVVITTRPKKLTI